MNASDPTRTDPVPRSVRDAVADVRLPALVVDLDAVDANADDLVRRAGGTPIRLASKSVRIPELMSHVLAKPGFQGVLAYTLPEALMLFSEGVTDDILVAYPTADDVAVAELAADASARAAIAIMVDSAEQLPALARHASEDAPLRVCLDVDASWKPVPGVSIGTLRSPTHSPRQAAALARAVDATPGLKTIGVMMYEGHIAGVGDDVPGPRGIAIRLMQKLSRKELAKRRAKVVAAVENAVGPLELVNGGGTGSLESTCAESAVTEAAAGSGLVAPALFDTYRAFTPTPASWFVMPVVRRPRKNTVTVAGGGRIASGPAAPDRMPTPTFPAGLEYAKDEGPGEVQTPLTGPAAASLHLGDRVWFRHTKAGETAEHGNEVVVVSGGAIVGRWATYRGKGLIYT
ncbi:alanine racemase [uncultured Corynebacterium sp.]|uniref:alanine racemase n=1 Tax=uncultured Corynebacterium sp. TaxID=159447 RepID=UPI0025D76B97|nr:alanine racemase [uncultured Corynebacterium sp.]